MLGSIGTDVVVPAADTELNVRAASPNCRLTLLPVLVVALTVVGKAISRMAWNSIWLGDAPVWPCGKSNMPTPTTRIGTFAV